MSEPDPTLHGEANDTQRSAPYAVGDRLVLTSSSGAYDVDVVGTWEPRADGARQYQFRAVGDLPAFVRATWKQWVTPDGQPTNPTITLRPLDVVQDATWSREIREAPMPTDPTTAAIVAGHIDAWWTALTPGQRMTVLVEASTQPERTP